MALAAIEGMGEWEHIEEILSRLKDDEHVNMYRDESISVEQEICNEKCVVGGDTARVLRVLRERNGE